MIELTVMQLITLGFICGFSGALFNEFFSKVEELYEDYKKKKESSKQKS